MVSLQAIKTITKAVLKLTKFPKFNGKHSVNSAVRADQMQMPWLLCLLLIAVEVARTT